MSGARIVVVEDDEVSAKFVSGVLESAGYDVAVAVMAVEALGVIERQQPALVVTDVRMPGASGVTLLEHLRSNDQMRALPVVVYTSLDDDDTLAAVERAGRATHLRKPARPDELLAAVAGMLGGDSA